MSNGIHVELVMSACEGCPVAALSSSTRVEELRVDAGDDRVEFVAADPPSDPPSGLDLVEFAGQAHGRYEIVCDRAATDGGVAVGAPDAAALDASGAASVESPDSSETLDGEALGGDGMCGGCSCGGLPAAFSNFPVSPRRTEMVDGELLVSFVLSGHDELSAIVDECEASGLSVELRRLCVDRGDGARSDDDGRPSVVPVDLAGVTDRQAEVATVAAEMGYFDGDGASAEAIADELGLAKSTVSEHLRAVTSALFSQLFGDGDRT
ncbi:helix-turn-helix domain-containing protein [Halorubrum sp. DTA46]|uniref:helix-turn-helix domain-containing protein n=1 Tax=Halorubrum sp. DTA46 TaxID=3402162 RepID=UPI003AADCA77